MNARAAWIIVATGLNARHTAGSFAVAALAIANGRSIIE
jgi:hypothetical protein